MEVTPSERANELFRSRLEQLSPQKEKPWKYFATAAAVLVTLGSLFFLHLNKDVLKPDTALVLPKPAEETGTSATEAPTTGTPAAETPAVESLPVDTEAPAKVNDTPTSGTPAGSSINRPTLPTPERVLATKASLNKGREEAPVPPAKNFLSDLQSLNPEIRYRYHSVDLTDFAILDTHSPLELETPKVSPRREAPEKTVPLLARVVREVKYVVNGEKPDLDRAGIKPVVTTFAQNQEGLLAHESRQIKEGIHKFKELFK